jgi:sigma-B regulation protein RsbU (phosphoserine phosphatase)
VLPGGGEHWVAVLVPARDLLDDRDRLLLAVLGLTAFALALALASAHRVARSVAGPVEALVERSERIAAGDFEPESPVASDIAEVARLALAQESMRAGLKTLLKLERDLQLAAQIQRATWPKDLPEHPGLDIAAAAYPADETGGDGYDLVSIPGEPRGGTFLFLADATGHGIGPALSVTQLRAMLRMAVRSGHGLSDLVKPVNDQLCADLPRNRFITAWFGRLDADGRKLESLSAGQAPLLHYHAAEDRLEVMKADLPPLGLFPSLPPARPREVELKAGDLWVVLSDGFYEAADPEGEELGVERIGELLRRCRTRSASEILAELRAELARFTRGVPAADDQTAILLRRTR